MDWYPQQPFTAEQAAAVFVVEDASLLESDRFGQQPAVFCNICILFMYTWYIYNIITFLYVLVTPSPTCGVCGLPQALLLLLLFFFWKNMPFCKICVLSIVVNMLSIFTQYFLSIFGTSGTCIYICVFIYTHMCRHVVLNTIQLRICVCIDITCQCALPSLSMLAASIWGSL